MGSFDTKRYRSSYSRIREEEEGNVKRCELETKGDESRRITASRGQKGETLIPGLRRGGRHTKPKWL